jgi:hypothetical protein
MIYKKEKITLPTETWVELYGVLSNYVLEYSSLDPITKTEPNGAELEEIKNGGFSSPEHLESYHEKK